MVCQDVLILGRITCMIDTLNGNVIGIACSKLYVLFKTLRLVQNFTSCSKLYVLYPRQNLSSHRLRTNVNENNKFSSLSNSCHVSMIFTLVDMLFACSKMSAGHFASLKDRSTFERIG